MTALQTQTEQSLEDLIDEFAILHEQMAPLQDRYDALKKTLAGFVNADKTDTTVSLLGNRFVVDYSAPTKDFKCNLSAEEFLGETLQWGALTVSTTKAKQLLSAEELSRLFSVSPGSRRLRRVRHRV